MRREIGLAEPLKNYDPRHGPALGLFEKSAYPVCRCPLAVNDLLILFTDGLYEIQGTDSEEFGEGRLLEAFQKRVHLPMERLFDELLVSVQAFAGRRDFDDDVCLVGMEAVRLGPSVQKGPA